MPAPSSHVALLRGINLGRRRLPMKDLAAIFEETGAADVRTYIQSGNVVYRASAALARRMPVLVEAAIAERFGFDAPVVTRTAAELAAVVRANPYLDEAEANPKSVHVGFLRDEPAARAVAGLDPDRSPPDTFVVEGREIFFHFPNGLGKSKLTTPWFDSRLGTVSTIRNWRTVTTLEEMARK
ncbi:MAG TPA: DUF1697 domain-containing protein [Gemmatimonadota bacterium]|nr:DUF1697 domain-containing protein [Gemmatimonadota bacterium]